MDSSTFPWVGATTVSDTTATRMLSNRSSCWRLSAGFGPALGSMAAVSMTGAGSALPVELTVTEGWAISVSGSWKGSAAGTNSWTDPTTVTSAPTPTAGAVDVNTKMPSEVSGRPSSSPGADCRKNPFERSAVTMPRVWTAKPTDGDTPAGP